MNLIYKYELEIGKNDMELPLGSHVLSVANQAGELVMWVLFNTDYPGTETREVFVVGTGNPFNNRGGLLRFIGSVSVSPYVWHVFVGQVKDNEDKK